MHGCFWRRRGVAATEVGEVSPAAMRVGFQFLLPLAPPPPSILDKFLVKTLSPRTRIVYAVKAFDFASAEAVDSGGQFHRNLVFFELQSDPFSTSGWHFVYFAISAGSEVELSEHRNAHDEFVSIK